MKRSILSAVFAVILVFTVAFLIAPKANAASITLKDGETLNITEDAILDLAGNSGSVHVAEGVKLSVIDSGNKNVTGANAGKLTVLSGSVEAEAEDAAGRRFLKLQNADGTFSFHPFYVTIKQVGINTNKGTLCLQAMFVTNEIAQKAVSTGIVYGEGQLTETAPTNGVFAFKDGVMYAYYDLMGSFANQAAMEKVKSFRAYFAVGETPIYSKTLVTISPVETLNTVSERFATFSDYQQSTMMKMIESNPQLQELPAVTEILRLTALSADKQTVQEMNEALTYVRAESFGAAKESLREYGFGEDDNFVPKTEGHSFRWLAAENVVLLVDENDKAVYPAEYANIDTTNIRAYFDLTLPATKVENVQNPIEPIYPVEIPGIGMKLAIKYIFIANAELSTYYGDWKTTFYASCDLPDGFENVQVDIPLAGYYEQYGDWKLCFLTDLKDGQELDILRLVGVGDNGMTYTEIQEDIGIFECGIVDVSQFSQQELDMVFGAYDPVPAGTILTVELRLTNPENPDEIVVAGIFHYTFQ